MRFWVEKSLVADRPDRQSGEHALGLALWSPQRAEGGRDIYRFMREVQPGDVVFHFTDNQQLDSYSIVSGELDESFTGLAGTDWADRPAYRIQLRNNTKILPAIPREAFLGERSRTRSLISNLLASETGLFFNREFNLNQGSYLTAAPLELVQIWNDIHLKQTGQPLNPDWNIPSLDLEAMSRKTYWIFQGNPDLFDIDRYVSTRQEIWWSVRQYRDRLQAGDEVFLWRSGADGGVIARCTALSSTEPNITEDAPELWKTHFERDINDRKCRLRIIEKYVQQPIQRDRIKAALPELPVFRFAQNTNYPISESDYRKILQMKAHDTSRVNFSDFTDVEGVISRCGLRTPPNFLRRLIASLAAKPFVILTGTSGTGKTKIAQAIALWLTSDREAYKLIPVGADWTGNDNIVGYPDGLDQNLYVGKPALELIWRATENADVPHFLVLDEMNLSHVERYFADLLSATESREEIPLYSGSARSFSGRELPKNLALPANVFILGTVNVDETTYMFSPKVLDRANVLEFRVEASDLVSYFDARHRIDLMQISGQGTALGAALVRAATQEVDTPSDVRDRFESEMVLFFNALKPHGVEFGYRVAHEAARFVYFYHQLSTDDTHWFDKAFDAVVVQKLLPKLHGQRTRLAPLLKKLWFLCVDKENARGADGLDRLDEVSRSTERSAEPSAVPTASPYPISAEKIARMWRLLNENGFASFAEA